MRKLILILLLIPALCFAKPHWEKISYSFSEPDAFRLQIPHGWLVVARIGSGTGMIFLQDEKHEWKINND